MQQIDDLFQRLFRLILSGNVCEAYTGLVFSIDLGIALAEGHGVAHVLGQAFCHEAPQDREDQERQYPLDEQRQPDVGLRLDAGILRHIVFLDIRCDRSQIFRRVGDVDLILIALDLEVDLSAAGIDLDRGDFAVADHLFEFTVQDLFCLHGIHEAVDQDHQHDHDDDVNDRRLYFLFL